MKTIGIFLPNAYRGGSLSGARNIAQMLKLGSKNAGEPVRIIFSCVANFYNLQKDFAELIDLDIPVRETVWKKISKKEVEFALTLLKRKVTLTHDHYVIPTDGINNFQECDLWLIISDRLCWPLAPIKPYGVVTYDYIQRYMPEIFPPGLDDFSYISTVRQADFVLTTTPATRNDAIQYAGVSPKRLHLAPMEFNPFDYTNAKKQEKQPYFIWTTNCSMHKNHVNAIHALDIYYRKLNGKLQAIMTGPLTDLFLPDKDAGIEYVRKVSTLIDSTVFVKKNLSIKGNLSVPDYIDILSQAKFLWHPTLVDNGTFSVMEAAYHGTPALSHDYSQMRYINERFQLNLNFCDARNADETAMKLKEMETMAHEEIRLPDRKFLDQFNYRNLANEYWNFFRNII